MIKLRLAAVVGLALTVAAPRAVRAQNVKIIVGSSIPDISALEYRAVRLTPVQRWPLRGTASEVTAHLWVKAAFDADPKIGFGWDGVPYELQSVGDKADWRADIEAFLANKNRYDENAFPFDGQSVSRQMLMALGATDLQRKVGAAVRLYGGTNPQAGYLQNLRDAGVASFGAGQFSQAQLQLNQLIADWPAKPPENLDDLRPEARMVLADIERRAGQQPRPTDEVAGLIWDLQNVRAYQMSVPGTIIWAQNPTVQKLINVGDGAVEPLLDALENDDRLTRSLYAARVRRGPGAIGTVRQAAQSALEILLNHRYSASNYQLPPAQQGADIAAQMRADWLHVKGETPTDRVFNALNQSGQTPQHLLEAAYELVRVGPRDGSRRIGTKLQMPGETFFGEPLRARQNPGVSDLLETRINELTRRARAEKLAGNTANPYELNNTLGAANELAVVYAKWDAARALPLLSAQLEKTKQFVADSPSGTRDEAQRSLNRTRREFLSARLNSPQRAEAMDEYAEFLQSAPFGSLSEEDYAPLALFPDEPALKRAAHALFDAPAQPFLSIVTRKTSNFNYYRSLDLLSSSLIKNPIFRDAVLRALRDKTVVGNVVKNKKGEAETRVSARGWNSQTTKLGGRSLEKGDSQPLRLCDLVASNLRRKLPDEDGQTRSAWQLDITLPTAERDARLKQIAESLKRGNVAVNDFEFATWNF